MFTSIIVALMLVVVASIAVWLVAPGFRQWIEAPKHRILQQERRFYRKADVWDEEKQKPGTNP